MTSAIKELLGKEAHELTDEELADLIRGNRPKIIESKSSSKSTMRKIFIGDSDDEDSIISDEDDEIFNISLDDAEERN